MTADSSSQPATFDPTSADWVMVEGAGYVFEPYGAEFLPPAPGSIVLVLGDDETRSRGVEVTCLDDRWVSVWTPPESEAYWLPKAGDSNDRPWETRLSPLDHERGTLR